MKYTVFYDNKPQEIKNTDFEVMNPHLVTERANIEKIYVRDSKGQGVVLNFDTFRERFRTVVPGGSFMSERDRYITYDRWNASTFAVCNQCGRDTCIETEHVKIDDDDYCTDCVVECDCEHYEVADQVRNIGNDDVCISYCQQCYEHKYR